MFTIEFVIVRSGQPPIVVEQMTSTATRLLDAEPTAKSQLANVRKRHPATPPDSYQILSNDGRIILRSWERKP